VTDNARYVVAFVLLPVVPALAVFLPSGLVVDRIVVGVIVAILVSALSARLALTDGRLGNGRAIERRRAGFSLKGMK
jgi:hypothetical protein